MKLADKFTQPFLYSDNMETLLGRMAGKQKKTNKKKRK